MITPSGNSLNLTYCKDRRQALRAEQRELNEKRDEALDDMNQGGQTPFDTILMEHYVHDLGTLLQSASFLESKTFIGTFIRRIDFDKEQVGIEYTLPVPAGGELTATKEFLSIREDGSPSRIRTYDLAVNSRIGKKLLNYLWEWTRLPPL